MRWLFLPLFTLFIAWSGLANSRDQVYRIGVLAPTGPGAGFDLVSVTKLPWLAELGFVEGRNLVVEIRSADGVPERLPALARELVQTAPDVIIAHAPAAIQAARAATGTIPIVMSFAGEDPVAAGWVVSLARPGGNLTGLVLLGPELDSKRLELLHEAVPDKRRIAVLVEPGGQEPYLKGMQPVADALGLELLPVLVTGTDYAAAFATIRSLSAGAVVVSSSTAFLWDAVTIATLAAESGLPTMCPWAEMARAGCFLAYGASRAELRLRTASYVARILRGGSPADLPVERVSVFMFTVNARTARQISVALPSTLLSRADEVIE